MPPKRKSIKIEKTSIKIIHKGDECLDNQSFETPYPDFERPFPHEVANAVAVLSAEHGVPERGEQTMSVLDSLVRTILSQNTTDKTSRVAFANLKKQFATWKEVLEADSADVEESIRNGGLAEIKTSRIKTILNTILSDYGDKCTDGEPTLQWMHEVPTKEVKDILSSFKGVGPKTVSCVLMFNMARHEFPVDTHVWHIAKKLQWVPAASSRETCYDHLNCRVPGPLKYALHVLLVEHGKCCPKCAKGGRLQHADRAVLKCPLTATALKAVQADAESAGFSTPASATKRAKVECCTIVGTVVDAADVRGGSGRDKKLKHLDLQSGLGTIVEDSIAEAK